MATEYYQVLRLDRNATQDDVKRAFKKLALSHHPQNLNVTAETQPHLFPRICEAYDVLSNQNTRALYDNFGEQGLKFGAPDQNQNIRGGKYAFTKTPEQIFTAFFGANSPFEDLAEFLVKDAAGKPADVSSDFYGTLTGMAPPSKYSTGPVAKVIRLELTLAEFYTGCVKKLCYTRRKLRADSTTEEVQDHVNVRIQPGWDDGTVVKYSGKGDEGVDQEAADLHVMLEAVSDPLWSREGDSLTYNVNIELVDALCGFICDVPTLDGRTLSISINQVVSNGYTRTVTGEGMPNSDGRKGDLVIAFTTIFPARLEPAQRELIRKALS